MKDVALSSWWSPHRYWHVVVNYTQSPFFSKLNKPHFLSLAHAVRQPPTHSRITGLSRQPSILLTFINTRVHCWVMQKSCSPDSPFLAVSLHLPSQLQDFIFLLAKFQEACSLSLSRLLWMTSLPSGILTMYSARYIIFVFIIHYHNVHIYT